MSVTAFVVVFTVTLTICFAFVYFDGTFEKQLPGPCNYTFYIMDGQDCQALFKFYDCENGGTIEVSTDKPIFDTEAMQRLLATEKTSGLKGYKNRFESVEDGKSLRVKYQIDRIALTDTLISIIQNFKSK